MTFAHNNEWFRVSFQTSVNMVYNDANPSENVSTRKETVRLYKRLEAFNWQDVGVDFESAEDAQEYAKYIGMLK